MLRFLYRQLAFDALRTTLTAMAIAAVVAAILILEGFNEGLVVQMGDAVTDRRADLIVTQAGVSNMIAARSVLPQFTRREVEAVSGVAAGHPITGIPVIYAQAGKRTPMFLLVHDGSGGPERLVAGSRASGPREIVIDRSLAAKYELRPGDPLVVSDFEFRISGIAGGAAAVFTPFGFARYDDLIDFYFESDVAADISTFPLLSFLLVELATDADRVAVAQAIERHVSQVDVFFPEDLAAEEESLGRALFGPIMKLLIGVGYVIGVLVAGVIMFGSVNARRHEFGVMKALGFSNRYLSGIVLLEAVMLALFASPVGVLLAALIGSAIEATMPLYRILSTEPVPVLRTVLACLLFGALGALIPIRLIHRLDPGLVFRS